jgi:thiamine biosynthesis lipoprotein
MIHQVEFRAMGCRMMVALDHPSPRIKERLQRVKGWFEIWEQSLSRFRQDSELSQLNRQAGSTVQVSNTIWEVYKVARQAELRSAGLVTPNVLDALEAAGYKNSFDQGLPATAPMGTVAYAPDDGTMTIITDQSSRTICLPSQVHLDFGGVAKGWAAHQAMKRLQVYGPVLMDAGGDIAVSGCQLDGSPWPIGIANPLIPEENLEVLMIGRRGIATSGKDYRRWQQNDRWQHHIIDPRTGMPAETDVLSATIVAPTVIEAEFAAKLVLILGSQAGLDWLESQAALNGMLVLDSGECLYSQQIGKYFWSE